MISIHAPRVGCDANHNAVAYISRAFQSTHPVWGATWVAQYANYNKVFQSTHPVWGATRCLGCPCRVTSISIHAPRVGCDLLFNPKHRNFT